MKTLGKLFLVGVFALAFLALVGGAVSPRPATVAATPAAERPHLLRPETHAELKALRARMDALDAEARCKSNKTRLVSGECD